MYWSVRSVWSTYRNPCSIPPEQGILLSEVLYAQRGRLCCPDVAGRLTGDSAYCPDRTGTPLSIPAGCGNTTGSQSVLGNLCSLPTGLPTTDPAILQTAAIHTTTPSPSVLNNGQMTNCFPKTRRHYESKRTYIRIR